MKFSHIPTARCEGMKYAGNREPFYFVYRRYNFAEGTSKYPRSAAMYIGVASLSFGISKAEGAPSHNIFKTSKLSARAATNAAVSPCLLPVRKAQSISINKIIKSKLSHEKKKEKMWTRGNHRKTNRFYNNSISKRSPASAFAFNNIATTCENVWYR